ncbi:MAG: hypothetical protein AUH30_19130 [Candidatus Rokubacteria bacterium 13_1_40CM_68_15]|nr:MAG: hypothetical protein AUH30_19130 [Candidatus Rokubacteria bacterium 13_1_40CM_68_15]
MEAAHHREIGIGEDVAIQHEHRPPRQVGGVADAAAGAEGLRLDHVAQAYTEVLGLAESLPDVVDAVRAGEDDVGDAVVAEQRELVGEERPIQQGHDRLRAHQRQWAQPCALATGEDDGLSRVGAAHALGFQGCASSISITGMPSRIG